jgi:hypothetical protein
MENNDDADRLNAMQEWSSALTTLSTTLFNNGDGFRMLDTQAGAEELAVDMFDTASSGSGAKASRVAWAKRKGISMFQSGKGKLFSQ